MFEVKNLTKEFQIHNQMNVNIKVFSNLSFSVKAGECVGIKGPSGTGKSTLMRMLYGNYLASSGSIIICEKELVGAEPKDILELRRFKLGYVSQFLRVLPRVSTFRLVSESAIRAGVSSEEAEQKTAELLSLLRISENLWDLSPLTFSGGEQQRINIARGFIYQYPALLLDEPTASLDRENRETVVNFIETAKANNVAIIGIFHDETVSSRLCDWHLNTETFLMSSDKG
ncbi:MAG: phosphonate C-P lyase system protein PhnL [SAR116 cluster bacterium]|nr:MAG: phosphonate C-P lyase system protein PhnL [SAR116 cluster bacterium]